MARSNINKQCLSRRGGGGYAAPVLRNLVQVPHTGPPDQKNMHQNTSQSVSNYFLPCNVIRSQ